MSVAGDLGRIMGVVSSFWDSKPEQSSIFVPQGSSKQDGTTSLGDKVGYLDPDRSRVSARSLAPAPQKALPKLEQRRESTAEEDSPPKGSLPNDVRMITHYDDLLITPATPVEPLCTLPNITQSPVSLLAAVSGGPLDLNWLDSFDDSALESLVPRDPESGRPLTIGSLEHAESKCRPCIFHIKAKCFKGLRCSFCHFNHSTLRKQVPSVISGSSLECSSVASTDQESVGAPKPIKSKRLRPSKRTRELIKQINQQMMFQDADLAENLKGPILSVPKSRPCNRLDPLTE